MLFAGDAREDLWGLFRIYSIPAVAPACVWPELSRPPATSFGGGGGLFRCSPCGCGSVFSERFVWGRSAGQSGGRGSSERRLPRFNQRSE
jgi:hypothetical protein